MMLGTTNINFHEVCFNFLFNIHVGYPNDVRKYSSAWIPSQSCFHTQMGSRCERKLQMYWISCVAITVRLLGLSYCQQSFTTRRSVLQESSLAAELAGCFIVLIQTVDSWILRSVACTSYFIDLYVSFSFFVQTLFIRLESIFFFFWSISHKFVDYFYACVGLGHEAAPLHLLACVCASVGTCVSNIVFPRFA